MKKHILYFAFFSLCWTLNAQKTGLYAGLNGAFQFSLIANSNDFDTGGDLDFDGTPNYSFGLDLGYKFKPNIGFQTGFLYSKQGQNYITANIVHANYKTELIYYKIPFLFCYHIKPEKKFSWIARGGLQLSLLSEAMSSRKDVFRFYDPKLKDVRDFYSSYTIDFVLGFGLQYNWNKLSFNLMLQSDYSLSDIEKTENKPGLRSPSSNISVQIPQLGFHYYFN